MIHLAEEFIPWDIYSARVLAARRSYFDLPQALFWVQEDETQSITAALSFVDGFIVLAAKEQADIEELTAFLRMQPWSRLQCADNAAAKLPFDVEWRSMFLRYDSPVPPAVSPLQPEQDPGIVHDIVAQCFDDVQNRSAWMADLSLRWRRGTAQSWVMDEQCTVTALALTENYAFLGAVGTLPQARGKGLAGTLLRQVAAQLPEREIWISCREALQGFYESVGFVRQADMVTMKQEREERE